MATTQDSGRATNSSGSDTFFFPDAPTASASPSMKCSSASAFQFRVSLVVVRREFPFDIAWPPTNPMSAPITCATIDAAESHNASRRPVSRFMNSETPARRRQKAPTLPSAPSTVRSRVAFLKEGGGSHQTGFKYRERHEHAQDTERSQKLTIDRHGDLLVRHCRLTPTLPVQFHRGWLVRRAVLFDN